MNFFSHSYVHTLGAVMVKYTAHILMLFTLVEMDRQTDRQTRDNNHIINSIDDFTK